MIEYNIISTGSKGNAVVINRTILIDCGVPFRALKDVYRRLQLVLLTHGHGDHFMRSTIRKLAQERPALRWACRDWLVAPLLECGVNPNKIDVLRSREGICYGTGEPAIESVDLPHNVPNCGWKVILPRGERMFYATDTNRLDGVEARNYDLYMVEANYDEAEIVERIRCKEESGEHCYEWDVMQNHLSRQKSDDWLYQNMGPKSRYVYLHGHVEDDDA